MGMKTVYNVYIDSNKIGKSTSYSEAIEYLKENYDHILPHLTWEPLAGGGVDKWGNGISEIIVERHYPDGIDLQWIIDDYNKKAADADQEEEKEEEIDHEERKRMPFTPRRTNLKMKKKKRATAAKEGDIMEGEDGKKYIAKRMRNGNLKWTKYVEKTYVLPKKGRKCPAKPAKNFDVGVSKKGLDGKMWVVTKMTNGNQKWSRK